MFAETRDSVRARIKSFIAEVPAGSGAESASNLAQAAELLPALFGDSSGNSGSGSGSGSGGNRVGSGPLGGSSNAFLAATAAAPAPSSSRKVWWGLAGAAVFAVAVLSLRGKHPPPPAVVVAPAATVPPQFAPVPSTTPVHIETSPTGALVEWNGQPLARTPAEVDLPPGTQTLKISRDGYEPEDVTIEV